MALTLGLLAHLPSAQGADLYVLLGGPQNDVQRLRIDGDQLQPLAPLPLLRDDLDRATYHDLVTLPGGDLLLADGTGQKIFHVDGDSGHERPHGAAWSQAPAPRSVVVDTMIGPNQPDRLLIAYDPPGRLLLHDIIDDQSLWSRVPTRSDSSARIERAISLDDGTWALAIRWPDANLSTVEVADAQAIDEPHLTLWSDPDRADAEPVLPELHPIRDLEATADGHLLVTSRDQLALVDASGQLQWQWSRGSLGIGGEFQGARLTGDGRIALIARQPGLWNQTHTRHRLYLVDPGAPDPIVDTSSALPAAPMAVAAADGQAPTGQRGHLAGADQPPNDLSALALDAPPTIDPDPPTLDAPASLELTVTNEGSNPLSLRRLEAHLAEGSCSSTTPSPTFTLWGSSPSVDLTEQTSETTTIDVAEPRSLGLGVGDACLRITAVAPDLQQRTLLSGSDIQIAPPENRSREVEIDVLSDQRRGDIETDSPIDGSSSCATTSPSPIPLAGLLGALLLMARLRRHERA